MIDTKTEIKALAKWCQQARELLGKGLVGDSSKMEDQIKDVSKMLKSLSNQTGDTDKRLLAAAMEDFRAQGEKHQALTLAYKDAEEAQKKTKKGSKEREAADLALEKAREDIRALMADMKKLKDNLVSDAPLAKAIHFFEISLRNAENRIKNEMTQAGSDTRGLPGMLTQLTQWKNEVETQPKYSDPKNVIARTNEINSLLSTLVGGSSKQSGESRKGDKKQSRARGDAEKRLDEAKQLLAGLKTRGELTVSIETQLTEGIARAESLHEQEQWIEGKALLKTLPNLKTCQKAFDKARADTAVDFRAELQRAETDLGKLKLQVDTATWQSYDTATKLLVGRTGDPGRKIKDNVKLIADFRTHLLKMYAVLQEAPLAQGRVTELLRLIELKAAEVAPVAPVNRADENRRQIALIKLLQTERRWREAEDTALLLQTFLTAQDNEDYDKWKREGLVLRAKRTADALTAASTNPQATPALKAQALSLLGRIGEPKLAQLELVRDWTGLMDLHGEVTGFISGLEGAIKQFEKFAKGRERATRAVDARVKRCSDALFELERALTTAKAEVAPVVTPMKSRLQEIKAAWAKLMLSAAEESDMGEGQIEQDLNGLMQVILSANVGRNLDETFDAQHRAVYDKAVAALERDGLVPLEQLSVSAAAGFRQELIALEKDQARETDPAQPWAQRVLGVQAIAARVTTSTTEATGARDKLNRELTGQAELVDVLLKSVRKDLESKGILGSVSRRYEPMLKFLEDELGGLRQLLDTSNATGAAGNAKLLADLKRRATSLVEMVTHSDVVDGREERVETHAKKLEALRKDKLDTLVAETNKALGEQLKELRRDMYGMEPEVLNQELDKFDEAMTAARTVLDGVLAQKAEVTRIENDVRPRIGKLRQGGQAIQYYDKLIERVQAAVTLSAQPAKLAEALTLLGVIVSEVTQAETDPEAALKRQTLQNTEAHAQELLKEEYKGRLEAVSKTAVSRASRAITEAGGDQGQLDEVKKMIKLAEKAADSKDYQRAIQTLLRTENRVLQIEQNPAGTALGDRNALPKHLDTYASQINLLRDQLGAFVEAAVAKTPDASKEAVRKLLGDAVAKLKVELNPRLFDLYAPDINDEGDNKGPQRAKRRAVRDQALQRLRELRVLISTQPTLVKLANNPILPVLGPLKLVDSSLNRLEAHLRAAIR